MTDSERDELIESQEQSLRALVEISGRHATVLRVLAARMLGEDASVFDELPIGRTTMGEGRTR